MTEKWRSISDLKAVTDGGCVEQLVGCDRRHNRILKDVGRRRSHIDYPIPVQSTYSVFETGGYEVLDQISQIFEQAWAPALTLYSLLHCPKDVYLVRDPVSQP